MRRRLPVALCMLGLVWIAWPGWVSAGIDFRGFQLRDPVQRRVVRTGAVEPGEAVRAGRIELRNNASFVASWTAETHGPYWVLLEVLRVDPEEGFVRVGATWSAPAAIHPPVASGTVACMVDAFAQMTCRTQAPHRLDLRPWIEAGKPVQLLWRFCEPESQQEEGCVEVWTELDVSQLQSGRS